MLLFEYAETKLDEFAHGRAQGGHVGFAARQQARIKRANVRLLASSHDRRQTQRRPDARGAGFGPARAAGGAGSVVTVNDGYLVQDKSLLRVAFRVLVLLETPDGSSEPGVLTLKNDQTAPLPHDRDSKAHRRMMSHLRGDDREYESMAVYVKTEPKARLGGQVEWTDVYVKQANAAPVNVSRCDRVDCGQPALSPDGKRVAFVKAAAPR